MGSQTVVTIDMVVPKGQGRGLSTGDVVGVKYTAWLQSDNGSLGPQLDSNAEKDGFYKIVMGERGKSLAGWHEALTGVRKGGKRIAVLPPAMAYGPAGSPPSIPANATLVFELEAARVKPAAPAAAAASAPAASSAIPMPPGMEPQTAPAQPAPQTLFEGFPSPADTTDVAEAQKEQLMQRLARAGAKPMIPGSPAVHTQPAVQPIPAQPLPPQQQPYAQPVHPAVSSISPVEKIKIISPAHN